MFIAELLLIFPSSDRPTEYAEQDVYLMENRYNESGKEIKRAKPLKVRLYVSHKLLIYYYEFNV